MSFYINNNILKELEHEVRKIHSKLIVGIAHNVLKDPSKIPEMKEKYLKEHPNTNLKDTIRPPRVYMNDEQEEEAELKRILTELEGDDDDPDVEPEDRCLYMVRVNRKIRQCKHPRVFGDSLCKYHEDEIIFPFGLKSQPNKVKNDLNDEYADSDEDNDKNTDDEKDKYHNDFLSDDD